MHYMHIKLMIVLAKNQYDSSVTTGLFTSYSTHPQCWIANHDVWNPIHMHKCTASYSVTCWLIMWNFIVFSAGTYEDQTTVQLTAKFTLVCAIHTCVVQFYFSDLSKLTCHMRVRLLVLHSSRSWVLHLS